MLLLKVLTTYAAVVMDAHNLPIEVYSRGTVTVDRTPLLPPTITSNTHPDFNRWYAHNSPQIELRTTPSVIPGRQYSFILNRMPESVPDTRPEALIRSNALVFTGLSDGIWWVHVRARDALGYWTGPSHFGFKIDSSPPPIVSNLPLVSERGRKRTRNHAGMECGRRYERNHRLSRPDRCKF